MTTTIRGPTPSSAQPAVRCWVVVMAAWGEEMGGWSFRAGGCDQQASTVATIGTICACAPATVRMVACWRYGNQRSSSNSKEQQQQQETTTIKHNKEQPYAGLVWVLKVCLGGFCMQNVLILHLLGRHAPAPSHASDSRQSATW